MKCHDGKVFFSERRPPRLNGAHCAVNVGQEGRTRTEVHARQVGTWVVEMITVRRGRGQSVLNTMQGLVVIDEIMCHTKREPYRNVNPFPGQTDLACVLSGARGLGYFIRARYRSKKALSI